MATFIVPPSSCDWTAYTAGEENGHQWTLYPTGSNRWTNWTCGHRFRGLRPTDSQGGLLSPSGFPLIIMRSFGYQRSARNLSLKHTGPTVGHLKHLGRLGRVWEQIWCVQLRWKLFGHGQRLSQFNWEGWLLAVWAIGFSDWLCASCMTILIGGVLD